MQQHQMALLSTVAAAAASAKDNEDADRQNGIRNDIAVEEEEDPMDN